MIRLHFFLEGQTEETFQRDTLSLHLVNFNISADGKLIAHKKTSSRKYKGGILDWQKTYNDIGRWTKEDDNADSWFTTMFDLYALPNDFPGYGGAQGETDPYSKVKFLENALKNEIKYPRFIPYFQLYEFEALLFSDLQKIERQYPACGREIQNLVKDVADSPNPELINDNPETAPSKRIIKQIPAYDKKSAGPIIANHIGLPVLRAKCRHFNEWLTELEKLGR